MAIHINKLDGGNITITTGSSAPASHEETWYKYNGDTGWRTVSIQGDLTGSIDTEPYDYASTTQIPNVESVVELEIGTDVTSIGDYSFYYYCSRLTSVTIPNSVTSIGDNAFFLCIGLMNVTIPDSVTSIGGHAFEGCDGLTSITIGNGVTSIGDAAFQGCSGLTSVTIPNSVTSIGQSTFTGCSSLTSVTIGSGIQRISGSAFNTSGSPITLTIGKTVAVVEAMGTTDYNPDTSVPYSQWYLPSGSIIVCTNGTIPIS